MSQHWTPEDDTATGGRPSVDDDTEGHFFAAGEQPGVFSNQDDEDTEGHSKLEEQPGVIVAGEQPGVLAAQHDEDDTEGHLLVADKAGVRDDEGDAQAPELFSF